jgi:hypothetical protein
MKINILGYDIRAEYILIVVLIIFIVSQTVDKEAFQSQSQPHSHRLDNMGANLSYIMGDNINGSVYDLQFTNTENSTLPQERKRVMPPYESSKKEKFSNEINIYKDLETNTSQQSDNEMAFFDKTVFRPDCCPSTYTSSSGCACMTPEQMKFLGQRGGNRVLDGNLL